MRTHCPSLPLSSFRIVATLDMNHEVERDTQAFLTRACSGRWPMWRLFGMRRHGDILAICVQWLRCRDKRYALVEVSLKMPALCWRYFPTEATARAALAALDAQPSQAHTPAVPTAPMEG